MPVAMERRRTPSRRPARQDPAGPPGRRARTGRRGAAAAALLLLVALAGCSGGGGGGAAPGVASPPAVPTQLPAAAMPTGIPGDWHLVFEDEFDGGSLDRAKWSTGSPDAAHPDGVTPPVNTKELDCYDASQVSVGDGLLRITAVEKQQSCGGRTLPYVSGMVNSKGKFSFAYGAMEARIDVPAAAPGVVANWPAFWSVGANWPEGGENDVMEGLHGRVCSYFNSDTASTGSCTDSDLTGWHVFASDWQPGRVDYYRDGILVATITAGITSAPMWLMVDNAVQPDVGGPTLVPATLQVDYVRVWQR
ncbi:family 16 glycosylhydrolase [Kitasatospora xanthocidica]|uniref:glycoside hydrolase family 16 protein n=1 Tax=Kitasatospora xanthocidica TaxID=83382 RepID=UPI0036E54540